MGFEMRIQVRAGIAAAVVTIAVVAAAVPAGDPAGAPGAAGRLDPRFGGNGIVHTSFGVKSSAGVRDLVLQPDGKALAVGTEYGASYTTNDIVVARYLVNGALDPRFGDGGKVVVDNAAATDAALQQDGKLLVVGAIDTATPDRQDVFVLRFLADGRLDPSFGTNGVATADLADVSPDLDYGFAVAIQGDRRIVIAGQTSQRGRNAVALALVRFRPDGRLDPSFGKGGIVAPPTAVSRIGQSILLQSSGRILVGGGDGGQDGAFLARFLPDGRLDPAFGSGGVAAGRGSIRALVPARDGAFVAVGTVPREAGVAAFLVRYDRRGRVDRSFGTNGRSETPVAPGQRTGAYAAVTDARDRIVAAGGNGDDFLVARYFADGTRDRGFGGTGVVTVGLGDGRLAFASAVSVRRDGTVLAAGDSRGTASDDRSDFALVQLIGSGRGGTRYGSLDAVNLPAGVQIRWQTEVEDGTRSFSVYRADENSSPATRKRLTRTPIRPRGDSTRYAFLDPDPPSYTPLYWLQELRRDGSRAWFGPISPS